MRIVADADILSVRESFSSLGELELVEGRQINSGHLRDADALLVRSITRVDKSLLADSAVRFIGTATSGIDHVDSDYLNNRNIQFAHARGCNANAVTEYCFAALDFLSLRRGWDCQDKLFSLIGAGHVGGLLARKLRALGIQCVAYDPLIAASRQAELETTGVEFVSYREALQADVISFHVPLSKSGPYPTYHLLSLDEINNLPRDCVLLNTSRGSVIANRDLRQALGKRHDLQVVLDVWEQEPNLDPALLDQVCLATPHIAGYSIEAKLNATSSLLTQFCQFFQVEPPAQTGDHEGGLQHLEIAEHQLDSSDSNCSGLILKALPLDQIDNDLRASFAEDAGQGAATFDKLRRQLAGRHEFSACQVASSNLTVEQQRMLQVLGFTVSPH